MHFVLVRGIVALSHTQSSVRCYASVRDPRFRLFSLPVSVISCVTGSISLAEMLILLLMMVSEFYWGDISSLSSKCDLCDVSKWDS